MQNVVKCPSKVNESAPGTSSIPQLEKPVPKLVNIENSAKLVDERMVE
ncbi:hypothetical protein A2U01_0050309, partial [Trifolium medium]|nr:hypothetical protein [Trifolium medium]